jgi:uncharacterized protein YukE
MANPSCRCPESAKFDLRATTSRGEAQNDYGSPLQVETEERLVSIKGTVGKGPSITMSTDRGRVTVKKESREGRSSEGEVKPTKLWGARKPSAKLAYNEVGLMPETPFVDAIRVMADENHRAMVSLMGSLDGYIARSEASIAEWKGEAEKRFDRMTSILDRLVNQAKETSDRIDQLVDHAKATSNRLDRIENALELSSVRMDRIELSIKDLIEIILRGHSNGHSQW